MQLILIRHGQTEANLLRALDTAIPGAPLTETGQAQAQSLPQRVTPLLRGQVSLWVSPILRTRQTIAPLEKALGLQANIRHGLREVIAGELEMRNDNDSVGCYIDTTRAWMTGRMRSRMPAGQSGVETFQRFEAVVREAAASTPQDGTIIITAHGTILRLFGCVGTHGADPNWLCNQPIANTGICIAQGNLLQGWDLKVWNNGQWVADNYHGPIPTGYEGATSSLAN